MSLASCSLRCGGSWTGLAVFASEQSSQRLEKSSRKTKHGDMLSIYGESSGRLNFDSLASEYEWGGLDFPQSIPSSLHTSPLSRESLSLAKEQSPSGSASSSSRGIGGEEGWTDIDLFSFEGAAPTAGGSRSGRSTDGYGRRQSAGPSSLRKQGAGGLSVRERLSPLRGDAGAEPWMDGFAASEREGEVALTESGRLSHLDEDGPGFAGRPLPPLQSLPKSRGRERAVEKKAGMRGRGGVSISSPSPSQSRSISPRRPLRPEEEKFDDEFGDDVREPSSRAASGEVRDVGDRVREGSAGWSGGFRMKPSQLWEEQAYEIIQRQKRRELERVKKGLPAQEESTFSALQQRQRNEATLGRGRPAKVGREARKKREGSAVKPSSPRKNLEKARASLAADVAVLGEKNQNTPLVEYLQGLGMGPGELAKVAERHRALLQLSVQVAKDRVGRLQALGVKTGDLCRLLVRHPQVLEYAPERYDTLVKFLRGLEVPTADVGKVITLAPALLAYSLDAVEERVRFLRDEVGVSRKDLPKIIARSPQILTQSVEDSLRPRARYLREEVGVSKEALARMVLRHPQLLHYSLEEGLRPRIKFLESIGIQGDDVAAVISRFSQVLSLSVEKNLHPKYSYLVKWLGGGPKTVTSYPAYFSLSLLERIRPRHLYLVAKQRMPYGPFPMKHLAITDREFVQQVAKSDIEDYLVFRNKLLGCGEDDIGAEELEKLVK